MSTANTQNVFDSFSEYQLRLLFYGWDIKTRWQFGLSCLAVFCIPLLSHLVILTREYIQCQLYCMLENESLFIEEYQGLTKRQSPHPKCWSKSSLYISYFVVSLFYYIFLFLSTLIASSFNPWIFVSLILGYSTGDILTRPKLISAQLQQKYT